MKNYFNGFAVQSVTVPCDPTVKEGVPVGFDTTSMAYAADEGTDFIGICLQVRDGYATVALKGYAELKYVGTQPFVGYNKFVCASDGAVMVDNEYGINVLVVAIDTAEKIVGIVL